MSLDLTEDQIIQLAPDAASVKAAKGLAKVSKWPLLEYSERALWGHCQGSGKNPYQTAIDLNNMAFKCSCPSRKFPCKHSLGLLFLCQGNPEIAQSMPEPDWVDKWLSKRQEKAEKKSQKETKDKPIDEVAQAKRQRLRHQKVLNGIEELQIWLKDLLHNGLISVPERSYTLFNSISKRMVDAQASGLANKLSALQAIDYYDESWKYILTDQLSKIYLLCEAYKHIEQQPEEWQEEIRTQIGYTQSKETILSGESISDEWLILHKTTQRVNDIKTEIYWLYGHQSQQISLYLNFITPGTVTDHALILGNSYQGELCLYRGVGVRRVLIKSWTYSNSVITPIFYENLDKGIEQYRKLIQVNPFAEYGPLLVKDLRFAQRGKALYVKDINDKVVPVTISESIYIEILAITTGQPFAAFFLATDLSWEIKSIWYQSKQYTWNDERN